MNLKCTPFYPQSSAATIFTPEEEMSEEQQLPPFEKEMRASLGADHLQIIKTVHPNAWESDISGMVFSARDHTRYPLGTTIEDAAARVQESISKSTPQPAPAPREISDEECEDFVRQAWKRANQMDETQHYEFTHWHDAYVDKAEKAIARYAIESRAPQTAPREEPCKSCDGLGWSLLGTDCPDCKATGITAPRDPYKRGQLLP